MQDVGSRRRSLISPDSRAVCKSMQMMFNIYITYFVLHRGKNQTYNKVFFTEFIPLMFLEITGKSEGFFKEEF